MSPPDRKRIPGRFLGEIESPLTPPASAAKEAPPIDLGQRVVRRLVVGCMTGTSIDGLDCALVAIEGHGLGLRPSLAGHLSMPLGELAAPLRAMAEQQPMSAGAIARLARDFALLHAKAISELLAGRHADLIAVHGQTVHHAPPVSWQLFNPAPLAHALKTPVVCDLRAADLAMGGQGAPLTPLADLVLFGHLRERRAVINLGGFCNLTKLPGGREASKVSGADLCACNQLLDGIARSVLGQPFDQNGDTALLGTVRPAPFKALLRLLAEQQTAGRSLGTGDELLSWINRSRKIEPTDLLRTACAAIAQTIIAASTGCDRLILAGGGVRNRALVTELKERSTIPVQPSDTLGVPAAFREAMAWAVLGALCQDRVAITLPQVTGVATAPVAGMWTLP